MLHISLKRRRPNRDAISVRFAPEGVHYIESEEVDHCVVLDYDTGRLNVSSELLPLIVATLMHLRGKLHGPGDRRAHPLLQRGGRHS
jgi:hypothetical protein